MKKVISLLVLLCLISAPVFAWGGEGGSLWKSHSVTNSTGGYITTAVSTSIIPARSTILGWRFIGIPGVNHEMVATLYDGPMTQWDEIIDEAEVDDNKVGGCWFEYPRTLAKQIYVHQGPGTIVTIFYE